MANFGARLAWPTPDWVAYRREDEIARAHTARRTTPLLARLASVLRRVARSWATAQAQNAFR